MGDLTFSELLDVSLSEPGLVNHPVLYTVLKAMLDELEMKDKCPPQEVLSKLPLKKGEASQSHEAVVKSEVIKSPTQAGEKSVEGKNDSSDKFEKLFNTRGAERREWDYKRLEALVEGMQEGMLSVCEFCDNLAAEIKKVADMKTKGTSGTDLVEFREKIDNLEQEFKTLQEELKKRKPGGASSEELEKLEEKVEELEEGQKLFDQDHLTLEEVVKAQTEITQQFEDIKALGNEIKDMEETIALKVDMKQMEDSLALKGDLSVVETKADQLYLETAIEELGEAIGLLAIKFTAKNDEWEKRCSDLWRSVEGRMSRDIFDGKVGELDTRITTLTNALKEVKGTVNTLLYPDSSGVTNCMLCKRPAVISGQYVINEDMSKMQKGDASPFKRSRPDTPFNKKENEVLEEPELKLAPVSHKGNDKSNRKSKISVSKRDSLPHRPLIFTDIMLERNKREKNSIPSSNVMDSEFVSSEDEKREARKDSSLSAESSASSSSSPEENPESEITDVMKSSLPALGREIREIRESRDHGKPKLSLAPIYPKKPSQRDYNAPN